MNKIKIIDLLNMISKGEKIPKKIKWGVHELDLSVYDYKAKDEFGNPSFTDLLENVFNRHALNDEVEILEEEKQETKPITKKDFEALGYACGEIKKCFENGWNKSLKNKPLEDEKKIPEKITINENGTIGFPNGQWTARNMDKAFAMKINSIIDYLKSKGE